MTSLILQHTIVFELLCIAMQYVSWRHLHFLALVLYITLLLSAILVSVSTLASLPNLLYVYALYSYTCFHRTTSILVANYIHLHDQLYITLITARIVLNLYMLDMAKNNV